MLKNLIINRIKRYQQMHPKPLYYRRCIYYPTCSAYTVQAIEKYGLIKGFWLGLRRYRRCTPSNMGGVDPLP